MANGTHRATRGLFAGLFIVALGVVFLLDQEGIVSADYMFRFFWPAVFIFFGLEGVFCGCGGTRRNIGIVLTAIGILLLLSSLNLLRFHIGFELIWPLVLIWVGVWIILHAFRGGGAPGAGFTFMGSWIGQVKQWGGLNSTEKEFDNVAIFGGVKRRITAQNFKGGRVMTFCAGFQIDLSHADIEGESATIEASACMGGGEIRVPDAWIVDIQGVPLLGGYVDETHPVPPADPSKQKRLIVKGVAFMGGIVVKN